MAILKYLPFQDTIVLVENDKDKQVSGDKYGRTVIFHVYESDKITTNTTDDLFRFFNKMKYGNSSNEIILCEDCNPYLININYRLFVYFGEDVPKLTVKSIRSCTADYRKHTLHSWKDPNIDENYVRVKVADTTKLFSFSGNTYKPAPWEIIKYLKSDKLDSNGKELSVYNFIFKLDYPNKIWLTKKKELETKEENERLRTLEIMEQEEINKQTTAGHCSCCGKNGASYLNDPYQLEMYGTYTKRWLCSECYNDISTAHVDSEDSILTKKIESFDNNQKL